MINTYINPDAIMDHSITPEKLTEHAPSLLTFTAGENDVSIGFKSHVGDGYATAASFTIEYSLDDGRSWTTLPAFTYPYGTNIITNSLVTVPAGKSIKYRGNLPKTAICIGGPGTTSYPATDILIQFYMDGGPVYASGDVTSLYNGVGGDVSAVTYQFYMLFFDCSNLITPPDIPVTSISSNGCNQMFHGCTGLTKVPYMSSITSVGEHGCSSMFSGCTSLVEVMDTLPAMSLGNYAYSQMFYNCTGIVKAPYLPVLTTTANNIYNMMFYGCTSLNYIKADLINNSNYKLNTWVQDVSSTGTFVKNPNATWKTRGVNGVPTGWDIVFESLPAVNTSDNDKTLKVVSGEWSVAEDTNISEETVAGWGFTKNAGTITGITMNGASKGTSGVVDLGTVITDVSGKADSSAAIGTLSLSINSSNYQITLSGTKVDGTTFTVSDVIDLPLESVVVSGSYDDTTKKVILTLKNGTTIDFSIADLIDGLQSEITSTNKLSADLIEDGTTNKTVTATEKQTWNSYANVQADWEQDTTTEDDYIENKPPIKAGTGTNSIIGGYLTNNIASGQYSISTGIGSVASGQTATSIGAATIAKGAGSVAEGFQTSAMRTGSHSQNYKTVAFGNYSHSEGSGSITDSTFTISGSANTRTYTTNTTHNLNVGDVISYGTHPNTVITTVDTISSNSFTTLETLSTTELTNATIKIYSNIAVGDASHSENSDTKALGDGSHAEGFKSIAEGSYSHSEGNNTKAIGIGSHAEGSYTITENQYEHTQGQFNKSNKANTTFGNAGNTIDSIGIGTSESARKNAFEVMQNGDVYVFGIGEYDGTNPTTADTLQEVISNSSADLATPITYSALVTLKTGGNLVPGMQYRITDYVCTAQAGETQVANNVFDIIVMADDESHLNENARACHHTGDTYFQYSNLEAWKLKYCLDNDDNRFAWADTTNGKGVIYYMKDEWNNECPYDFKNIQFKRYAITAYTKNPSFVVNNSGNTYGFYYGARDDNGDDTLYDATYDDNTYDYFYTFALKDTSTGNWEDFSLYPNCYNNYISPAITINGNTLNNIVLYSGSSNNRCNNNKIGLDCYLITCGDGCYNWSCGDYCTNWTCGNQCSNWICGNSCTNWTCGNQCENWVCGNGCDSWTCGNSCGGWICGNNCINWICGNSCHDWICGNQCNYWHCGNNCYNWKCGNKCENWICGNNCYQWSVGNNCGGWSCGNYSSRWSCGENSYNWTCGTYCTGWHCGNDCYIWTCGTYVQDFTMFDNVNYVNINSAGGSTSSPVKNFQILNGTKGTQNNRLAIDFTANKNYTQVAGLVNGTDLRIWIAEDTVTGPSTSTRNNLAAFDGTTGKVIKDSGVALSSLYTKPSTGIPSTDLAQAVQTSLGLADTALQSYTETDPIFTASAAHGITSSDITNWNSKTSNVGTITGITMNNTSKGTSGVVDLGTVVTSESDPVFTASAAYGITSNDITNWNNKTSNVGTITGITMNGTSKGTSGVVNLGTVITSETALSKGTTTGNGNAVTDISVSGHEITLTKGTTFLTEETDPVFGSSAAAGITTSQINQWNAKVSANDGILTIQKNGTQVATFSANQTTNQTANIQVNELPSVSASDNGKILMVVNGAWSLVTPVSIYSGTSTPDSSLGDNGDLYIQTNS